MTVSSPPFESNVPADMILDYLAARGVSIDGIMSGAYTGPDGTPITLEHVEMAMVADDRVLFCTTFMRNPKNIRGGSPPIVRGEPMVLFDYQAESAREMGDVIHEDGAETGKTQDISVVSCHALTTIPDAEILLGAPEYKHITEIVRAINDQRSMSPFLKAHISPVKKDPHHYYTSSIGGRLDLIPSGHYGSAFRGTHVSTLAMFDEAAVVRNEIVWDEFFRSLMPGCNLRIYSVPKGIRSGTYYRMCKKAKEGGNNKKRIPRKGGSGPSLDDYANIRYFHWPKTIMPLPFWGEQRKLQSIDRYGSETSPGYVHNVLGENGEPENPVFPYIAFMKCVQDVPEYKRIEVGTNDRDGTTRIVSNRLDYRSDDSMEPDADLVKLTDEEYDTDELIANPEIFFNTIQRLLPDVEGLIFCGNDSGKMNDPSETLAFKQVGEIMTCIARIVMRRAPYDPLQGNGLAAMGAKFKAYSFGVDRGNAGTALVEQLVGADFADHNIPEIVVGYAFNEKVDSVSDAGETLKNEKTGKPLRQEVRDLGVTTLVRRAQKGTLVFPRDLEIINSFTGYTSRVTPGGVTIYSKTDDHIVDAAAQAIVGKLLKGAESGSCSVGGVTER